MALLWLFGIALVLTPFAVLHLLLAQRRLRAQLATESEENARRHAALQREVVELRKQIAAAQAGLAAATRTAEMPSEARPAASSETKTPVSTPVVTAPPVATIPAPAWTIDKPEPPVERKPEAKPEIKPNIKIEPPAAPLRPVVIPPAPVVPPKPTMPPASDAKPSVPTQPPAPRPAPPQAPTPRVAPNAFSNRSPRAFRFRHQAQRCECLPPRKPQCSSA